MKANQKGFSVVEILIVIVVVGLLGMVGWLVYDRQKTKKLEAPTPTTTQKTEQQTESQNTKPVDETASWLQYESPGKEFRFKVADGWKLHKKEGTDTSFYSTESLALRAGTKGEVLPYVRSGPGEFGCGLYWDWQTYTTDVMKQVYKDSIEQLKSDEKFSTASGLEVRKKYELLSEGGGYSPAGTKSYSYFLPLNNKSITIGYSVCPGDTDYHDVVEKVIKTIESN